MPDAPKLPEGVLDAGIDVLWDRDDNGTSHARHLSAEQTVLEVLRVTLPAIKAQHFEEFAEALLSTDEVRRKAGEAAYLDYDPTGDFDLLEGSLRMTWEGNTAAGIEAAIECVKEQGDRG